MSGVVEPSMEYPTAKTDQNMILLKCAPSSSRYSGALFTHSTSKHIPSPDQYNCFPLPLPNYPLLSDQPAMTERGVLLLDYPIFLECNGLGECIVHQWLELSAELRCPYA